jgi:hypothetical protein
MTFAVVDKGDAARTTRRTSEIYVVLHSGARWYCRREDYYTE